MNSEALILVLGFGAVLATLVVVIGRLAALAPRKRALHERLLDAGPDVKLPRSPRWPRTPLVAELTVLATQALGNRSRKVNEILLDSEPTPEALLAAVDEIPKLGLLFIDQERLDRLADQMRARIAAG